MENKIDKIHSSIQVYNRNHKSKRQEISTKIADGDDEYGAREIGTGRKVERAGMVVDGVAELDARHEHEDKDKRDHPTFCALQIFVDL